MVEQSDEQAPEEHEADQADPAAVTADTKDEKKSTSRRATAKTSTKTGAKTSSKSPAGTPSKASPTSDETTVTERMEATATDAVERASQMLGHLGQRVNERFAATSPGVAGGSATERADAMMERFGSRAGLLGSTLGMRAMQVLARAREEGEDIWAEAQHIRRGGPSSS